MCSALAMALALQLCTHTHTHILHEEEWVPFNNFTIKMWMMEENLLSHSKILCFDVFDISFKRIYLNINKPEIFFVYLKPGNHDCNLTNSLSWAWAYTFVYFQFPFIKMYSRIDTSFLLLATLRRWTLNSSEFSLSDLHDQILHNNRNLRM